MVLSDLKMPLLNGLELLAWFKHQPGESAIPFVLMTSSDAQSDRDRACENGADDYLLKPSRFEDLVKAVASVWERHSIG
jgi:two-component system response regulator